MDFPGSEADSESFFEMLNASVFRSGSTSPGLAAITRQPALINLSGVHQEENALNPPHSGRRVISAVMEIDKREPSYHNPTYITEGSFYF